MSNTEDKLGLMQRVRALDIASSRRQVVRRAKELAGAAAERIAAEDRQAAAASAEEAALILRNANPADREALLYSQASLRRTDHASAALHTCRGQEAEAENAAARARHGLVRAETRHDAIAARLRLELARLRRRAERRGEDDRSPASAFAWSLD